MRIIPADDTSRDSQRLNTPPGASRWLSHGRLAAVAMGLSILMLVVTGCGASTPTGASTTPTATPGSANVSVYFTRHPASDSDPTKVFAVTRAMPTTVTTTVAKATYALQQLFAGPTQAERSQGYYSPFDGQLALQSVCPGEFRDFDLNLDHRGATAEAGTATLQFCRRVDIPGDLAGPRMAAMVTSTLLQFTTIKKVVILNSVGECFDDLQGANACLNPAQTGYPVKVYYSRHPDSDSAPTAVFAVNRTSPTLGVATYALSQLIAGPTPSEAAQGYFTPLQGALTGASTCNGADVEITLNRDRTQPETGTATMQFCRHVPGFGDTGAAVVRNEITRTLTQFSNIQKVVITYQDGSCFDDMMGC